MAGIYGQLKAGGIEGRINNDQYNNTKMTHNIQAAVEKAIASLKTWKFWKELIIITLAMWLAAASIYYFVVPGKIVLGSISGLSIVIEELFAIAGMSVKVSTIVLIVNILLLILAYALIGSEFGIKTAYASLILGPLMDLSEWICPYDKVLIPGSTSILGDLWFDMLGFVILISISQALLFHLNASTGGLDVIAKIVNKFFHFDIGTSVTVAGVLTCCTGLLINPPRMVIIGIIVTWVNGLVIDYFLMSLSRKKRVCIISDESERIREYIVKTIVRGCSLYEVTGGYSSQKRMEIQALLTTDEFAKLMEWIKDNDIKAFITAGNVSEVYGLWSEHSRKK